MPFRVVINPVVVEDGVRRPKVGTLVDLGRPPEDVEVEPGVFETVYQRIQHTSAIATNPNAGVPNNVWNNCLSVAVGISLATLDADASIINLLETVTGEDRPMAEFQPFMALTPNSLGWNAQKRNRIMQKIQSYGGNTTGLSATAPLWQWVNAAGSIFQVGYDCRLVTGIYVEGA